MSWMTSTIATRGDGHGQVATIASLAGLVQSGGPARVERYERVGIDVHQLLASEEVAR